MGAEAERLARMALAQAEDVGRKELITADCRRIGQACAKQGRKFEGLSYARRAVDLYKVLRSPNLAEAQAVLKQCEG